MAVVDMLGRSPSVGCSAGRGRRRADRDTRGPHRHGQVWVEGGSWIQDGVGPPARNGWACESGDRWTMGYRGQSERGCVALSSKHVSERSSNNKLFLVYSNEPIASFAVQFTVPEVSRVDHFVGRSEELDAIHRSLESDGSQKIAVVNGLGGMGKTQLALAYAKRHKDEYSAVLWVNSKDVDTLKQGYADAARRIYRDHPSLVHLKAVAEGSDMDAATEAVKQWLSSAGNDRWLIIYDNHDTPRLPGHDKPGTFDIRPFLPEADHGAILITTRTSQLQLGRPVAVKKLQDIEHSMEILSQTSRRDSLGLGKQHPCTSV
jgi:hypothetical protein